MIYTDEQVAEIIKAVLTETALAFQEWIQTDTIIIDKSTKELLPNAMIDLKPECAKLTSLIYPRLERHGILFTTTPPSSVNGDEKE